LHLTPALASVVSLRGCAALPHVAVRGEEEVFVKRLLAIDDEMSVLIVLNVLFKTAGFEVVISQGGQEAVDLVEKGGFDIILTDVRMNPINGFEFAKISKAKHPETPVIMISAYESPVKRSQLHKLGVFSFVKKPFDNNELLRLVRQAVETRSPAAEKTKS
jgi:DNA-binding NtrC family response regulator